ncbi:ABC-type binding-protein-dependent transport systems inner membrane component [Methanocaldococcus bathoardescens]|uniref:ABC-type binding-protein-dependent transport systems inner membrane component n=2 Tax=Methanocaldococcus bathoardescens TaxID=1301915 RepID=A0A076LHX2_9EURY|nr:ABC-type binding-protein-dependent transport systems inner membrane component [Methanocaldococcus bathoardescens]
MLKNKTCLAGLIIISLITLAGLLAPIIAKDPYETNMLKRLSPPSLEHPFGTDQLGRDLFSRIVYGARVSLIVAITISIISLTVGCLIGAISGYIGGVVDDIIGRIIDVFLAIPELIFNIALVGVLCVVLESTSSIWVVIFAIIVTNWVSYARLTRGIVLSLKEREFITSARMMGASDFWILLKHIIPNAIPPIIVLATLNVGNVIMTIASLGFLGLGIQPPTPEWGQILNSGKNYLTTAPWIMVFPGLAIMLAILGFNLLGDGLRDVLEPKSRRVAQ